MQAQYETQLLYRRMDEDGDIVFGAPGNGFIDGQNAMLQVLKTRIAACEGEWWEGDDTAIPWFTDVLGSMSIQDVIDEIDLMVVNRIMDTVGVNSVSDINSYVENRVYHFSCKVSTVYGEVDLEVSQ